MTELLKKLRSLPLNWCLWALVGVFFVVNLGLLLNSDAADTGAQENIPLVEQTDFDRISFWQQFLNRDKHGASGKTSLLDGTEIDPEYEERAVSVMVDNFVTARAQHSGVRAASVVYEALAEGGITRLMLVFPYQELTRVGPVRSARDYFVDFAEEYGGMYVHAGGSPLALEKLSTSLRLHELDEDDRLEITEPYSFRDYQYVAPHNLFFNLLLARERATDFEWELSAPEQNWCFDEKEPAGNSAATIDLSFANDRTSPSFVHFVYDESEHRYKRFYGSYRPQPHVDQLESLQVAPANLIVQVAPSQLIDGDVKERLSLHHIGIGKAFYFRDGKELTGTWEKNSASEPTRFLDYLGNPVCLTPGQTWIALLDSEQLLQAKE